jgi:hypothetical protein
MLVTPYIKARLFSPNESTCHMIKVKLVASELVAVVFCVMISMGFNSTNHHP